MSKTKNRALRLAKKVQKRARALQIASAEADAFIATYFVRGAKETPAWFVSQDVRGLADLLAGMSMHLVQRIEAEKESNVTRAEHFKTSTKKEAT